MSGHNHKLLNHLDDIVLPGDDDPFKKLRVTYENKGSKKRMNLGKHRVSLHEEIRSHCHSLQDCNHSFEEIKRMITQKCK